MSDLEITREGTILYLRFNRPERKNALTQQMYHETSAALREAESDDGVRAVLFLGAGGNFCSGNDLADFPPNPEQGGPTPVMQFLETLIASTVPVLAAVEGVAAGIGATMLLHLDSVVADSNTRIYYSFLNMALIPEAGSSLLMTRLLGYTRAAELFMRAAPLGGEEAHRLGIVSTLAEPGEVEQRAMAIATEIAAKPPQAMRRAKRLLRGDTTELMQRIREEERELFECFASEEHAKALQAFRRK